MHKLSSQYCAFSYSVLVILSDFFSCLYTHSHTHTLRFWILNSTELDSLHLAWIVHAQLAHSHGSHPHGSHPHESTFLLKKTRFLSSPYSLTHMTKTHANPPFLLQKRWEMPSLCYNLESSKIMMDCYVTTLSVPKIPLLPLFAHI